MSESEGWFRRWDTLVTAALATFVIILDMTMINVAISAVVQDLDTTVGGLQSAIAGYALVLAAFTITGGKLASNFGTRKLFVLATAVYGLGSLTAAFSQSLLVLLLGWSVIKGLGAAVMLPGINSLLVSRYSGRERAAGFGVLGATLAMASAAGPVIGGAVTTYISWRATFGGQLLVVLPLLVLGLRLRHTPPARAEGMDWMGTALSGSGLALLVSGAVVAGNLGWWRARRPLLLGGHEFAPLGLSPTPYLLAAGALCLVLFVHWEHRRRQAGAAVLIDVALLSNRGFILGSLTNTLVAVVLASFMFVVPVFLQSGIHYDPLQTGLAVLPVSVGIFLASLAGPRLETVIERRRLAQAGIVLMGFGLWLYARRLHAALTIGEMTAPFFVFGAGAGLTMVELNNLTLSAIDTRMAAEASGLDNSLRKLGNAMGTAIAGSILMAAFYTSMVDGVLRDAGLEPPGQTREQLILALENTFKKVETPREYEAVTRLKEAAADRLTELRGQAAVEAERTAVQAAIAICFGGLLLGSFLPPREGT